MLFCVLLATSCGSGPDAGWRFGDVGESCLNACKSDGDRVCWAYRQLKWENKLGEDYDANVAWIKSMSGLFVDVTTVASQTPEDW